mgnify:CR=1 FL=1
MISNYTLDGNKIKTFPSVLAAAHDCHCNPHTIDQALNKNNLTSNGYLWCTGAEDTCEPYDKLPHGPAKAVDVYDSDGNFIHTYKTITEAAKIHNVSLNRACVSYNDPGHNKTGGLYFIPSREPLVINRYKTVKTLYYYDKQTRKYLGSFESAAQAGTILKADPSGIGKAAKGKRYYATGYIWSYLKYEIIPADYRTINQEYWEEHNKEKKEK